MGHYFESRAVRGKEDTLDTWGHSGRMTSRRGGGDGYDDDAAAADAADDDDWCDDGDSWWGHIQT